MRKTVIVKNRIIQIDTISISPFYLKLYNLDNEIIDSSTYVVNFAKAVLKFTDASQNDKKVIVVYEKLPDFLTKTYKAFDESFIVDSKNSNRKLYQFTVKENKQENAKPIFYGLETTGHLSRGITMGNNQDGVVNSGLELQLKGKLSSKVQINANITDNNIPLQDNGYTQRLNEYDRIFVEMYSKSWKLSAGDLFLNNKNSQYLNFNKKVAGLGVQVNLTGKKAKTQIYTSGAIVKGKFTRVDFNGQEANQGPYRLAKNNQPFLLIIADSETVYVNGIPLNKEQYTLDYSSSEIVFATTYPIHAAMRIQVEFQASEQNYTRFVSFNKVDYSSKNFNVGVSFYNESDSKSKNLQQELNDAQKKILFNAGDDVDKMYALSAIKQDYEENAIQYKKDISTGVEIFVFSNDPEDDLYNVRFTYVGENKGDYSMDNTIATGRIYKYKSAIGGVKQGSYEPKIQLEAPLKLQVTTIKSNYTNIKTRIETEIAFSNQDKNLFSNIDDNDNQGIAGNLLWSQLVTDKKGKLYSTISYEHITTNFNSVERIKGLEFNRDWNIKNNKGTQGLLKAGLLFEKDSVSSINYQFENLNYSTIFNGIKHALFMDITAKKTTLKTAISLMKSNALEELSSFSKINADIKRKYAKFLIGIQLKTENNLRENKSTQELTDLSFKNQSYGSYLQIKDSLRTKLEIGYTYQLADSLKNNTLTNVNVSNNYYIKSTVLQKKTRNLDVYVNYKKYTNSHFTNDKSIHSKISYQQQLADNLMQFSTVYETSSGAIPQQEFTYQKVDVGKGYYTWVDYNGDGIQNIDEFEVAQFQDEAVYVRVLLPSSKFIRTNQTAFNQLITINPSKWRNNNSIKKIFSYFINQTNLSIQNKQLKTANFQFNPLDTKDAVSLQYNLKNFLFLNRGKQHYSATYSYLKGDNKTVFITGTLENNIVSNQLQFSHAIAAMWLIDLEISNTNTKNSNERYASRNMDLKSNTGKAKLSYLFNDRQSSCNINVTFKEKENASINNEKLKATNFGIALQHVSSKKYALNASFHYINNDYSFANQNSAISYQLLEGLQNGKNYTGTLILQKTLTKYLDFNLNYNVRKSENLKTIHTGTLQLRAKF